MKQCITKISIIFICSLLLGSCKKKEEEQWKAPAKVGFKFDINRNGGLDDNLYFTGGSITLREFSFDGKRVQGEDTYFEKSFTEGLQINLESAKDVPELNFDIPQGNYTKITIKIEAEGKTDFSIVMEGSYKTSGGTTYPLRLETEAIEIYNIIAKNNENSNEIVLNKDVSSNAIIKLDPIHWFGSISKNTLDNASLTNLNGIATILINDDKNEDILDKVEDRIDEATEVIIN